MSDENNFESLPFNDAMEIYIEYLKASNSGNLKKVDKLFKLHPDLFQPDTLTLAKETLMHLAKLTKNVWLQELVSKSQ